MRGECHLEHTFMYLKPHPDTGTVFMEREDEGHVTTQYYV